MFWLGSLIALVGGLLSVGLSRETVKRRYRPIGDYHLDVAALGVLALGLVVSAIDHVSSEHAVDTVRQKNDYSDVARLNTQGKPFADGDIAFSSPLSHLMDCTYKLEGNTFSFYRTPEAEAQLRKITKEYPSFPFAHYALALCMRDRGDAGWRVEADCARRIFRITTSIPGARARSRRCIGKNRSHPWQIGLNLSLQFVSNRWPVR